MNILLISGHGAGDPGAMATIAGKSYREADETRAMTKAIQSALAGKADVTIYPTDRNAYADYKAGSLLSVAKFAKYDYVLEIHFNAFKYDKGDGKTKGVECYVTKTEKGTGVEEAICRNIAKLGLANRGVKRNNFAVISKAKTAGVSSALLEVCFLDDADDMKIYTKSRQKFAQAVANGIVEGFGLKDPVAEAKRIIKSKAGLEDKTIAYLEDYECGEALLTKLAAAMQ